MRSSSVLYVWFFFFFFFFFSSRRRHTRFDCDWSSDVCSSDLILVARGWDVAITDINLEGAQQVAMRARGPGAARAYRLDRSEERRVGKSVDLGGGRIIKKKKDKERYAVRKCSE